MATSIRIYGNKNVLYSIVKSLVSKATCFILHGNRYTLHLNDTEILYQFLSLNIIDYFDLSKFDTVLFFSWIFWSEIIDYFDLSEFENWYKLIILLWNIKVFMFYAINQAESDDESKIFFTAT
jgi:hypothetical protein